MWKKGVATLLALVLILTMVPVPAGLTAQAAQATTAVTADTLRPLVEQQVKAYAKSIAIKNSSDEAVEQLIRHAMFKRGKQLNAGASSALTAALMNSGVVQSNLIEGLTKGVDLLQSTGVDYLYLYGSNKWYEHGHSYALYAFSEFQENTLVHWGDMNDDGIPDNGDVVLEVPNSDINKRIGTVASSRLANENGSYSSPQNANDDAFELVIGSSCMGVDLTRTRVTADTAVYTVRVRCADRFDFNASYEGSKDEGKDTSAAETLTAWGKVLGGTIVDPFFWIATVEFEIELPYDCTHTGGSYQWNYDAGSHTLTSRAGESFLPNPAQQLPCTNAGKYYHRLLEPVYLRHDRPWVVQYDVKKVGTFMLLTTAAASDFYPYFYNSGSSYVYVRDDRYELLTEQQKQEYGATSNNNLVKDFLGVELKGNYKYSSKTLYTYRLENRVAPDGSNMIWLTVYNNDLQQTVIGPTAMDTLWWQSTIQSERVQAAEPSSAVSGLDFIINYIGRQSDGLNADEFALTIWENGEGAETESCFVTTYKAPTCTEQGGNVHTCTRCGYSEFLTVEPALGHSYGEYISDDNAQCEKDSTKTAACTVCKRTKTVTEPGTALAHQWKEATCDTLKHCTLCYKTVGSALGHSIEVIPEQPPTCTKMGFTAGEVCSVCGKAVTARKVIKATGHNDNNGDDWCDACALWMGKGEAPAPTPAPTPDQPTRTPGDINGDDEVNNKDATRLFQYLSGWDVEAVAEVLDVNGDGEVNNKDATRLFQYLSGWNVSIG